MEQTTPQLLAQSASEIINTLIARSWFLVVVALIIVSISQREALMAFVHARHKTFRLAKPILDPLKYTGIGLFLVYGAFTLTNLVTTLAFPSSQSVNQVNEGPLAILKLHAGYSGLVFTFMIVLAGLFMIPSAGNRWMVGVSKALLTLAIFYILFMGVIALA